MFFHVQFASARDCYDAVMLTRVLSSLLLCSGISLIPAACASVSTYPPTSGKTISKPNVSPGPEIMAGAVKEAYRVSGATGPIIFNLPAGLEGTTWTRVTKLLPEGAVAMQPGDENAFSVQQTRISGGTAEVDVIYPERGVYQLMTVKFKGGALIPWRVEWAYRWVIPANAPLANAPFVPQPIGGASTQTEVVGEMTPAKE